MSRPELYTTGGSVQAGEGIYIPRSADDELLELCRRSAFGYILYTRQVGKSSLMENAARRLEAEGTRSATVDLTQLGEQVEAEQWYLGFLVLVEDGLGLATDVVGWWGEHSHLGITQRLTRFFPEILLAEVAEPVVIFVDEIDTTLKLGFTDDFFAAIRSLYLARAREPELRRLSFVLAGVATPNDLIQDPERTPFNIGEPVDLSDFTAAEALPLAAGLGPPPEEARRVLGRILDWTGGHPYLTQRVCREVAERDRESWSAREIGALVGEIFFAGGSLQDSNLQFVRDMLTKRAPDVGAVLRTYRSIRRGRRVGDSEQSLARVHLKLSGVVRRDDGWLRIRNRIYRRAFDEAWIREHLPVDWRRALRKAALGLMVVLFAVSVPTAWWALSERRKAEESAEREAAARQAAEVSAEREASARQTAEQSAEREAEARQAAEASAEREASARQTAEQSARREAIARQEAQESAQRALAARDEAERARQELAAALERVEASAQLTEQARLEGYLEPGIAEAPRLAAAATSVTLFDADQLELSMLLAIESLRLWPSVEADQTLRRGLAVLGEPMGEPVAIQGELLAVASGPRGFALVESPGRSKGARLRSVTWVGDRPEMQEFSGLPPLEAAAFSEAGILAGLTEDGRVRIWRSSEQSPGLEEYRGWRQKEPTVPPGEARYAIAVSGNGRVLAFSSSAPAGLGASRTLEGTTEVWDLREGARVAGFDAGDRLLLDRDGKRLLIADPSEAVFYDLESGGEQLLGQHLSAAAFSPDDEAVALGFDGPVDRAARIIGGGLRLVRGLGEKAQIQEQAQAAGQAIQIDKPVAAVAFSADGRLLATAGRAGAATVWERRSGRVVARIFPPAPGPDLGRRLARDGALQGFTNLGFLGDGRHLLTVTYGLEARVWRLPDEREPDDLPIENLRFQTDVAISPGGQFLATRGAFAHGSSGRLWRSRGGVATAVEEPGDFWAAAFGPDPEVLEPLVVTSSLRDLTAWEIASDRGGLAPAGSLPVADVYDLAFSADGRYLTVSSGPLPESEATGDVPSEAEEAGYAVETVELEVLPSPWPPGLVSEEALTGWVWTPDTRPAAIAVAEYLGGVVTAVAGTDGSIVVLDPRQPQDRLLSVSSGALVESLAFSPSGGLLAAAAREGTVQVWSLETREELFALRHEEAVWTVAFSPDGRHLATASEDGTARLWHAATGREVSRVTHEDPVKAAAFSADGRRLLTAPWGRAIKEWPWRPEELIEEACSRLTRQLLESEWGRYFPGQRYDTYVARGGSCPARP